MKEQLFSQCRLNQHNCWFFLSFLFLALALNQSGGAENQIDASASGPPPVGAQVSQIGFLIYSGNGNRAIDPDECDALTLTLTNQSATAVNGIGATLTSLDPDVIVTQPLATFPNLALAGYGTNTLPFQISVLPSFTCGRTIRCNLSLTTTNAGTINVPIALTTGEISPVATRFDNNTATNLPDVGIIYSTNLVSGFAGTLAKVGVSLYLTHPSDQALTNISLIGPDGTTVLLSSANGGPGQNYGSGTADASRTTFDDAATNAITQGTAPFVGTFKPQQPLAAFNGKTNVNGAWRLQVADGRTGSLGILQAWSLFLYPLTCADGGGACALCPANAYLTNYLSTSSGILPQRLFRSTVNTTCSAPTTYPGIITNYNGGFAYQAYPFYNGTSNTCISVTLVALAANVMSSAYLSTFDPNNPQTTYLADSGTGTSGNFTVSYSFEVNPDTVFVIVVNEVDEINVTATETNRSYSLIVTGGDCAPRLDINQAGTNKVDVLWPAIAGDYRLETSPQIKPVAWSLTTNEPLANLGRFNVTNRSDSSALRIYRLHNY
jgi:subtilisin-like proprotein convertase family protein